MMSDPPRRRLPRWVSTLVVVALAVVFLVPGPWRGLEKVFSFVLTPIQMGVSGTVDEASHVVDTVQRVRELAAANADYGEQVDQFQSEGRGMRELDVENQVLRRRLSMPEAAVPSTLLPVQLIARD